jgi:hypothetical protein
MHLINSVVSTSANGSCGNACNLIGESLKGGKSLKDRMEKAIEGHTIETREKILKLSYFRNNSLLRSLPPVSWYLPRCLGGLGLPKRGKDKVSSLHLKIASMILCLDENTRREVVHLEWLKEPGKVFSKGTNEFLEAVHERLNNKLIMSTSKNDEDFSGSIIRSCLGFGVDDVISDPKDVLKQWKKIYSGWVKRVQKIKWTDSKDHDVKGLHEMSEEKALSFSNKVWTHEYHVSGIV